MSAAKRREQAEARELRRALGMPIKQIASRLGVSPGSVHLWTRGVEVSSVHRARNLRLARETAGRRWAERNREYRRGYQAAGREQARRADPLHEAGCMLYWAEGGKDRGVLSFCNSDRAMVAFFWRFLNSYFEFEQTRIRVRLNVYLGNGLELPEIEEWWAVALPEVPRDCFRNHVIDHYPTSSSGLKRNKLPHGVCTLRLNDTAILQQIYGAIQEYGGFENPVWLDGPPRKPQPARKRLP